jgi:predicted phage terminase large subunit-like protein
MTALSLDALHALPLEQLKALAEAGRAEQNRRSAKSDMTSWSRLAGYDPSPHHGLLLSKLMMMSVPSPTSPAISSPAQLQAGLGEVNGDLDSHKNSLPVKSSSSSISAKLLLRGVPSGGRLMVFMPPGSAKSTYCSVLFPAWFLGQDWGGNVLAASHSTELAERFGRKVRNLAAGNSSALGYTISADSGAAGRWETSTGREYYAAGAGVGIAGFRAKLGIIDDPFRGRADAESRVVRERIWEWYNDDFDTRCVPGAHQILIMTRYHEDDLAGRLLRRDGARIIAPSPEGEGGRLLQRGGWDVLSLPAIAGDDDPLGRKPGEWLWEGEYGYADQLRAKYATSDARSWASLYQQNPVPDTGSYFESDWLRRVTHLPGRSTLRYYGASDYAVTQRGGDYTVHLVVGIDAKGRLYVVDLWRGQTDSAEWVQAWIDLVKKWKPTEWAEEGGQIRSSIGPFLEQEANKARAYTYRRQFPSKHDKAVRAQSIRARMSMGGLYVPDGAAWLDEFEHELMRFPAAVHDDQVDALGLIGQLLDHIQAPVSHEDEDNVIDLRPEDYDFAIDDSDDEDEPEMNWKVI